MNGSDEQFRQLLQEIKDLQERHLEAYKEFTTWVREDTKEVREEYRRATEYQRQRLESERATGKRLLIIVGIGLVFLLGYCLWSGLWLQAM